MWRPKDNFLFSQHVCLREETQFVWPLSRHLFVCCAIYSDFNVFLSHTSPLQSSLEVGLLPQKYLPLQFRFCFP